MPACRVNWRVKQTRCRHNTQRRIGAIERRIISLAGHQLRESYENVILYGTTERPENVPEIQISPELEGIWRNINTDVKRERRKRKRRKHRKTLRRCPT